MRRAALAALFSVVSLLIAVALALLLPVLRTEGVSVSENALPQSSRQRFDAENARAVGAAHEELLVALCADGGARSAGAWALRRLRAAGWDAEAFGSLRGHAGGIGGGVHAMLRARGGAAGTDALQLSTALPTSVAALFGESVHEEGGAGVATACAEGGAGSPPATPDGALVLMALADLLHSDAPWAGKDIVLVLYVDAHVEPLEGGEAVGWWDGGLLGMEEQLLSHPATGRGARVSAGLAAWAAAHTHCAWEARYMRPALARAWRDLDLIQWARLLVAPSTPDVFAQQLQAPYLVGNATTAPLLFSAGPIRAAFVLSVRASAHTPLPSSSAAWTVLTQGANGRLPDLDVFAALQRAIGSLHSSAGTEVAVTPHGDATMGTRLSRATRVWAVSTAQAVRRSGMIPTLGHALGMGLALESFLSAWPPALEAFVASAWASGMGPSAAHGELLAVGIPAVTLSLPSAMSTSGRVYNSSAGVVRLGRMLEHVVHAFTGVDERLHAGSHSYFLLGGGRLVALNDYAIPIALLHAPVLLLSLLAPTPSAAALVYGLAVWLLALACGCAAFVALLHARVTLTLHTRVMMPLVTSFFPHDAIKVLYPASCPVRDAARGELEQAHALLSWVLGVALLDTALAFVVLPLLARMWGGMSRACGVSRVSIVEAGDAAAAVAAPVAVQGGRDAAEEDDVSLPGPLGCLHTSLVIQGCAFFPLLFYSPSLAALEALVAMTFLTLATVSESLLPPALARGVRVLLWGLTSPAAVGAAAVLSFGACEVAEGLWHVAGLTASYGAGHVGVALLLLLPLRAGAVAVVAS